LLSNYWNRNNSIGKKKYFTEMRRKTCIQYSSILLISFLGNIMSILELSKKSFNENLSASCTVYFGAIFGKEKMTIPTFSH
jgi:hypothetical protein